MSVSESLKAFMAAASGAPAHEARPGVLVVGSGKGGVGTSVLAALLALESARQGARVLLVDADEGWGSLHLMLGIEDPGPGLGALRDAEVEAEALLRPLAPRLWLLPGGGMGADATLASAAGERRALLRRVSGLWDRFDAVVLDGGSRLESVMAACATGAERLLCVTTGDRIAVAASYALLKVARERFGTLPTGLLVNRADEGTAETLHGVVRSAAGRFLGVDVDHAGAVPPDPDVDALVRSGSSLAELGDGSPARAAVAGLVRRILADLPPLRGDEP